MNRKTILGVGLLLFSFFLVNPVFGFNIKVNGDINNRFEATNNVETIGSTTAGSKTNNFSYSGGTNLGATPGRGFLGNTNDDSGGDSNSAQFGETKARLWMTAATDDNMAKGVWAIEVGSVKYGAGGSVGKGTGGGLSGDAVNTETRWLYVDFQNPLIEHESRLRLGLQPLRLNKWLWAETAMGLRYFGSSKFLDYQAAWVRTQENLTDDERNNNAYFAKVTYKPDSLDMQIGLFGVYYKQKAETANAFDLRTVPYDGSAAPTGTDIYDQKDYYVGVDGNLNIGKLFFNWDAIYETGSVEFNESVVAGGTDKELDRNAYFLHADVGYKFFDKLKSTFTWWYASGDDNPDDADADNYDVIDTDVVDSTILFEEQVTDDNSWTDAPFLLDKGFQMYRVRVDFTHSDKLTSAVAANYMQLAENALNGQKDIGFEVDLYATYKIWQGLSFNMALGYLFAGDALDAWTSDASAANGFNGKADDIYRLTGGIRYRF